MAQPEIEPATANWDEYKPDPAAPVYSQAGVRFAKVWLCIAAASGVSLVFLIATTIVTNALPDELGFGLWCLGAVVSLVAVLVSALAALVAGNRNRPAMRMSVGALLASGASLGAHVLTALYVLSTISFC